ncbi:hypothetical protein EV384_3628 [Micromonospora kangleipakensis]|uniref:Uncharacterized protein n=1 Tax=Micromonospora kangleipakensis TaxID=1077942 RepID=A0A4Q8BBB6_9ACTN|nr:hypothetical protein [Micromonospora kangleipakensis]RZU75104.1 hypothetical protein EV384_3628 [Micromonospora kangleipakensis]
MSAPTGDNDSLHELEAEVKAELAMAESSHPEEAIKLPVTEWLFDPADAQRDDVGLRSLLGAVETLATPIRAPHGRTCLRPRTTPTRRIHLSNSRNESL